MKNTNWTATILAIAIIVASAGCTVVYHDPPHAPAHGHVVRYSGNVELVFNSGLGLYVVSGYPNYYFYKGYFYHVYADGRCERSKKFAGPWKAAKASHLPPGLARQQKHHNKHYD